MKQIKNIILALLVVLICALVSAEPVPRYGAIVIRDEVTYGLLDSQAVLLNQIPDPAEPGSYVEIRFKIENIGAENVDSLILELMPEYPFSLDSGESRLKRIGDMHMQQVGEEAFVAYYKLRVDKDAIEGNNPIQIKYTVDGQAWTKKEFYVRIQTNDAILSIESVKSEPEQIPPGAAAKLIISLTNNADSILKDIKVNLGVLTALTTATGYQLIELPFTPIDSANEKMIKNIGAHESKDVEFNLVADASADSKIYKLPITLEYSDGLGKNYSKNYYTSLIVGEDPDLIASIDTSEIISSSQKGKVSVRFTNKGASNLKFLYVELLQSEKYDIISQPSLYVGSIDSDDYETADFDIYVKKTRDSTVQMPLRVEYRDANNKQFKKDVILSLNLYSSSQAQRYGLVKAGNSSLNFLVIVVILAGIWYYFKKRKKINLIKVAWDKIKSLKLGRKKK